MSEDKNAALNYVQEVFKGRVDADVVDIILSQCQYNVEKAVNQLLTLTDGPNSTNNGRLPSSGNNLDGIEPIDNYSTHKRLAHSGRNAQLDNFNENTDIDLHLSSIPQSTNVFAETYNYDNLEAKPLIVANSSSLISTPIPSTNELPRQKNKNVSLPSVDIQNSEPLKLQTDAKSDSVCEIDVYISDDDDDDDKATRQLDSFTTNKETKDLKPQQFSNFNSHPKSSNENLKRKNRDSSAMFGYGIHNAGYPYTSGLVSPQTLPFYGNQQCFPAWYHSGFPHSGMVPSGMAPLGMAPPGMVPPGMTPPGMVPPSMTPPGIVPPGIAPHRGFLPVGHQGTGTVPQQVIRPQFPNHYGQMSSKRQPYVNRPIHSKYRANGYYQAKTQDKFSSHPKKLLIILRGLPGSGKSTLARYLKTKSGVVISTDDYFLKGGRYYFNPSELSAAHEWNQNRAKRFMEGRLTPVIIDNTNSQAWEMKPYIVMGLRYGYKVDIREPETWWKWNIKELERRNSHGVTAKNLEKMIEHYEKYVTVSTIMKSVRHTMEVQSNNDVRENKEHSAKYKTNYKNKNSSSESDNETLVASSVSNEITRPVAKTKMSLSPTFSETDSPRHCVNGGEQHELDHKSPQLIPTTVEGKIVADKEHNGDTECGQLESECARVSDVDKRSMSGSPTINDLLRVEHNGDEAKDVQSEESLLYCGSSDDVMGTDDLSNMKPNLDENLEARIISASDQKTLGLVTLVNTTPIVSLSQVKVKDESESAKDEATVSGGDVNSQNGLSAKDEAAVSDGDLNSQNGLSPTSEPSPSEGNSCSLQDVIETPDDQATCGSPPVQSFCGTSSVQLFPVTCGAPSFQTFPVTCGTPSFQSFPVTCGASPVQSFPVTCGASPVQSFPVTCGASPVQSFPVTCGASPVQSFSVTCGASPVQSFPVTSGASPVQSFPVTCGTPSVQSFPPKCGTPLVQSFPPKCGTPLVQSFPPKCGASPVQSFPPKCGTPSIQSFPPNCGTPLVQSFPSKCGTPSVQSFPPKCGTPLVQSFPPKCGTPSVQSFPPKCGTPSVQSFPPKCGTPLVQSFPPKCGTPLVQSFPPKCGTPSIQSFPPNCGTPLVQSFPSKCGTPSVQSFPPKCGTPLVQSFPPKCGTPSVQSFPPKCGTPSVQSFPPKCGTPLVQSFPPKCGTPLVQSFPPKCGTPSVQSFPPKCGTPLVQLFPESKIFLPEELNLESFKDGEVKDITKTQESAVVPVEAKLLAAAESSSNENNKKEVHKSIPVLDNDLLNEAGATEITIPENKDSRHTTKEEKTSPVNIPDSIKECSVDTTGIGINSENSNAPDSLQFLQDCFPDVDASFLKSFLNCCHGDLLKTVDRVLEYNEIYDETDVYDSDDGSDKEKTSKTIETTLPDLFRTPTSDERILGNRGESPERIDLRDITGAALGSNKDKSYSTPASSTPSTSSDFQDICFNTLNLTLDPALALQLLELFGSFSGVSARDTLSESVLSVKIDQDFAKLLYSKWRKTVQEKNKSKTSEEAKLKKNKVSSNRGGFDGNLKRKFKATPREFFLPPDVEYIPPQHVTLHEPVSLKEIMDEQLAVHVSQSEEELEKNWKEDNLDLSTKLKRSRLHGMFPGIDAVSLNEIFEANNYNLDKTILQVQSSCGIPITEDSSIILPQRSSDFQPHSKHEVKLTNGPLSGVDGGEAEFQSLDEPTYEDFRAEANTHFKLRDQSIKKAALAYSRKQGELARFYADQARVHFDKIKEANRRAAEKIMETRNGDLRTSNTLDLHELHVGEAIQILEAVLEERKQEMKSPNKKSPSFVQVITGRGSRSRDGKPRIKPAVVNYLNNNGYRYEELNMGLYRVFLN